MKQLLVQFGLIGVSIIGVVMVIVPMYENIGVIQSETEEYQRALDSAVETNKKLSSLKQEIGRYGQQEKYRIELLVPQDLAPVRAAYDIEELIGESGMFLNSITVGEIAQVTPPVTAPASGGTPEADENTGFDFSVDESVSGMVSQQLEISVSGTYEQFKYLLSRVESSARLMDVTNVTFTGSDSDLSAYSLTVQVYGLSTDINLEQ